MVYNDLTPLCEAIPVSTTGTASTQASAVLKGLTGEEAEFQIGGGAQPTLFSPTCSFGVNSFIPKTNSQNGGFSVTYTATDGVSTFTYGSSNSITPEMDGRTLTLTASGQNFASGVATYTLEYIDMGSQCEIIIYDTYMPEYAAISGIGGSSYSGYRVFTVTASDMSTWTSAFQISGVTPESNYGPCVIFGYIQTPGGYSYQVLDSHFATTIQFPDVTYLQRTYRIPFSDIYVTNVPSADVADLPNKLGHLVGTRYAGSKISTGQIDMTGATVYFQELDSSDNVVWSGQRQWASSYSYWGMAMPDSHYVAVGNRLRMKVEIKATFKSST